MHSTNSELNDLHKLCKQIEDAVDSGKSYMDDDVMPLVQALADQTETIRHLTIFAMAAKERRDLEESWRQENQDLLDAARRTYTEDGRVEIDDDAKVSPDDDGSGAWVQAWVWAERSPSFEVGQRFISLHDETDSDEHDNERVTPAGSTWHITSHNNNDVWNLVCEATGASICPTADELATQFEPAP